MNRIKACITTLILCSSLHSWCQKNYLPLFFDFNEISTTIDSLQKNNVNKILILQTPSLNLCQIKNDTLVNIVLWMDNNKSCFLKLITYNTIYNPSRIHLDPMIFEIKRLKKMFVTKDEKVLKFTPPLTNDNAIFFIFDNITGYFEQPSSLNSTPLTYVPNNTYKEKKRKEFFNQLKSDLKSLDCNLLGSKSYDRDKELEESEEK